MLLIQLSVLSTFSLTSHSTLQLHTQTDLCLWLVAMIRLSGHTLRLGHS